MPHASPLPPQTKRRQHTSESPLADGGAFTLAEFQASVWQFFGEAAACRLPERLTQTTGSEPAAETRVDVAVAAELLQAELAGSGAVVGGALSLTGCVFSGALDGYSLDAQAILAQPLLAPHLGATLADTIARLLREDVVLPNPISAVTVYEDDRAQRATVELTLRQHPHVALTAHYGAAPFPALLRRETRVTGAGLIAEAWDNVKPPNGAVL